MAYKNQFLLRRYRKIQRRFSQMYHAEGKRREIIVTELSEEFDYSESHIEKIVCMKLPEPTRHERNADL